MKIFLNIYKDISFGNIKVDSIIITTNRMPVSFLKNLISQKYNIDKSTITLSMKMHNLYLVTMVDNYPLYFYNINTNSVIYVKIAENKRSNDIIMKKIKERENKSEYLRKLNIFKNDLNMDTIKESPLEDLEIDNKALCSDSDIKLSDDNSSFDTYLNIESQNDLEDISKIIEKRFNNAIFNNKIDEFKEIMKHYKDIIDINKPIGISQKYSPIHYASMFGYSEMMTNLITKYNADVNLLSGDGWSPLHLCAYNGQINTLNILIQLKNINFNLSLPNLGTALHCACKQNNLEIVSLLLCKCNPSIKNSQGLLPIELTNDEHIQNIINKVIKYQYYKNKEIPNPDNSNTELSKFKFLKQLEYIPVCPYRYVGYSFKRGKLLSNYHQRFIEINANKNFFLRFKFKDDYPIKTKEALFLSNITSCKLMSKQEKDNYFYIEIILNDDSIHTYRYDSYKVCKTWSEKINLSIEYSKFWKKMAKKYADVQSYLSSMKPDIYEIDYYSGEIKKFKLTKQEEEKQKLKLNEIITTQKISVNNASNNNANNKAINNRIEIFNTKNEKMDISLFVLQELLYDCNLYKIYKVKYKQDGSILIMKIFNKNNLIRAKLLTHLFSQLNMQNQLLSPFFVSLHHFFQNDENIYITLDYCPYNLSFNKNKIIYEEDSIKLYIAEIIVAMEYLHKIDLTYKNLSLEHIYITKDNHIKLADLQINKISNSSKYYYDNGTKQGTGVSADIYNIGAIIYELVCGMPPLYVNTSITDKIKEEELFLHNFLSENLKDLLSKLLCEDPNKRIGLKSRKQIKSHPWFKNINWDDLLIKSSNPSINFPLIKNQIDNNNSNHI